MDSSLSNPLEHRYARVLGGRSWLLRCLLVAAAYYATGRLALLLAIPPGYATAVWPPAGIALAGLLLFGYRVWPGVLIGSFLLNIPSALDATQAAVLRSVSLPAAIAAIAAGAALQALAGACLVRRFIGPETSFTSERDVLRFIHLGALVCVVNPTIGVTALLAAGAITPAALPFSWCTWWVGDTIGALIFAPLILLWAEAKPAGTWPRRQIYITAPLALTFSLAVAFFALTSGWEQRRIEIEFERQTDGLAQRLTRDVDGYLEALETVGDLLGTVPDVDGHKFDAFVGPILARHSGIRALSWDTSVGDEQRAAYENAVRLEGSPGFRITERDAEGRMSSAAPRPGYVAVTYISPYAGNERALGFDVLSLPSRRGAVERARDNGTATATGPIRLIQEPGEQAGVLVFRPVYEIGKPRGTAEERRASIRGYAAAALRVSAMVEASLAEADLEGIRLSLFDDEAPRRSLLYDSVTRLGEKSPPGRDVPTGLHVRAVSFPMAGRQWTIEFSVPPEYLVAHRSWQAWTVLAAGMLFTGLLEAFLLLVTGRTKQVEETVAQRTSELALARDGALESVRLKSAFLANMSHEIRTPLNVILGYTSILCEASSEIGDGSYDDVVDGINRAGNRLLETIHGIIDLSKIESRTFEVSPVAIDLGLLITRCFEEICVLAKPKGLSVACEITEPGVRIRFDEYCLSHALLNLLGNAVKFTDSGSITARLYREDGALRVEIRDTGVGIDPEYLQRLFEPFSQEQSGYNRRFEGSGLGLALTKNYLRLNGARISVESEKRRGSVFTIHFPAACEVLKPGVRQDTPAPVVDPTPELPFLGASRPLTLVVEDDPETQRFMTGLLGRRYRVLLAASGEEMRSHLRNWASDIRIVLMDLSLRGSEDGLMLTKELREREEWKNIPIIATTAHAFEEDEEKALAAGCDAYLAKPIPRQRLLSLMENLIDGTPRGHGALH